LNDNYLIIKEIFSFGGCIVSYPLIPYFYLNKMITKGISILRYIEYLQNSSQNSFSIDILNL